MASIGAVTERDKSLRQLRDRWDEAGKTDPFWAVLSHPDKSGNRWAQDEFLQTGVDEIRELMQHLEKLQATPHRGRVLDFGCGPGRLSQPLTDYFDQVDGVDISASMIELAQKLNQHPDRCHYHLNVADDLSLFPDSCFDLVYSNITLQHIEPKYVKSYLREFVRILKPAGVMVFQLPGGRRGTRARVMGFVPAPVRSAYRRVRSRHPAHEMHGWRRSDVRSLVGGMGAELLDVSPSHDAGGGWESFRYTWRKR